MDRGSSKRASELAAASEIDFQVSLWQLLAKQAMLYTMGESSSLSEYDAHRLLSSACYVLGINPDDPDPIDMQAIVDQGIEQAHSESLRYIEQETTRMGELWKEVCLSAPLLESVALKDTLESLKDFKARYTPRFFAHEIPADIDYPLCHPVSEEVLGVDYVAAYLERLLIENNFLNSFDLERCRSLLQAVHPAYGELIVNLFEPVAVNAVGLALAGADVQMLRVSDTQRQRIKVELSGLSAKQLDIRLAGAAERACSNLRISHEGTCVYVKQATKPLAARVLSALHTDGLAGVFLDW